MSSDFNFTVASWFLGNVHVKPISTHSARLYKFTKYSYLLEVHSFSFDNINLHLRVGNSKTHLTLISPTMCLENSFKFFNKMVDKSDLRKLLIYTCSKICNEWWQVWSENRFERIKFLAMYRSNNYSNRYPIFC